jgi:Fe-S-cluster containining protein
MAVFCLSVHAGYTCAHRGACCTAGWPIPVEPRVVAGLAAKGIRVTPVLETDSRGRCVFFEEDAGRLCAIHRQAGPELLPSACRHFPRVVLQDPRGTFVTLSHYCPTAAEMLLNAGPIRIVEAPASLVGIGPLEGLDARDVLPPLLRPGMLMDHAGYNAWEREAISILDRRDLGPEQAVAAIAECATLTYGWSPGFGTLAEWIHTLSAPRRARKRKRHPSDEERPIKAFVAAHVFASWAAYQNGGLLSVVDAARSALSRLRAELARGCTFVDAVSAVDLLLRHTRQHVSS